MNRSIATDYIVLSCLSYLRNETRGKDKGPDPNVHESVAKVMRLGESPRVNLREIYGQDAKNRRQQHRGPVVRDEREEARLKKRSELRAKY